MDVTPAGAVTVGSRGVVRLTNGTTASQVVSELVERDHWRWDGRFLWFKLVYDHRFEALPSGGCRITFTVDGEGVGQHTVGRVFALIYARNLDRSLPALAEELNRQSGAD